jgi:hypothetical protein
MRASRTNHLDAAALHHLAPFVRPASRTNHPVAAALHHLAPFARPASRTNHPVAAALHHLAPFARPAFMSSGARTDRPAFMSGGARTDRPAFMSGGARTDGGPVDPPKLSLMRHSNRRSPRRRMCGLGSGAPPATQRTPEPPVFTNPGLPLDFLPFPAARGGAGIPTQPQFDSRAAPECTDLPFALDTSESFPSWPS